MAQVKSGDKVRVHYHGKLDNGDTFDKSEGRDPLEFEVGSGMVIKGFDEGVTGMTVGEKKTIHIPAAEAYGHQNPEMVIEMPKDRFPQDMEIEVGMPLHMSDGQGQQFQVLVKDPEFLGALQQLGADLQVVVAFRMLPEVVWNMPRLGSVNLHGSLLPQYRGAAPINWAVINGEPETGVTTFRLKQEIDTGGILLQERFPVGENETAGEVHDRMMDIGANVLVKTVLALKDGSVQPVPQPQLPEDQLRHAPKIFTETCRIDFSKTVAEVHNLIRGLSPFPGAFTSFQGKMLKVFRSEKHPGPKNLAPGEFSATGPRELLVGCADGCISLKELQLEGKKRLTVEEFLRGMRI